jgi:hypothetical protein
MQGIIFETVWSSGLECLEIVQERDRLLRRVMTSNLARLILAYPINNGCGLIVTYVLADGQRFQPHAADPLLVKSLIESLSLIWLRSIGSQEGVPETGALSDVVPLGADARLSLLSVEGNSCP